MKQLTVDGVLNDFNERLKREIASPEGPDKKQLKIICMEAGYVLARVLEICFACEAPARQGECEQCRTIRTDMTSLFQARPHLEAGLPANMQHYTLAR